MDFGALNGDTLILEFGAKAQSGGPCTVPLLSKCLILGHEFAHVTCCSVIISWHGAGEWGTGEGKRHCAQVTPPYPPISILA